MRRAPALVLVTTALLLPLAAFGAEGESSSLELSLGAGGLIAFETAPSAALGAAVEVGLVHDRYSLAVEGRFDAPATLNVGGTSVSSSLYLGSILGCMQDAPVGLCLVGSAGVVDVEGEQVVDETKGANPFAAVGVRGLILAPINEVVALRAHAQISVNLIETELVDKRSGSGVDFWSTPLLSGNFGISALIYF